MQAPSRILLRLLLALIALVLTLGAGELAVRFGFYSGEDRALGSRNLLALRNDSFIQAFLENTGDDCTFASSLQAHPFLGFIHKKSGKCAAQNVNNQGFPSLRDLPREKDTDFFTILFTGGSVASQMANGTWDDGSWVEILLNQKYFSPNGKPFRALNAAFGGWAYPSQLIAHMLYANAADAVISIDGYNEAINFSGLAMDRIPSDTYAFLVNPPTPSPILRRLESVTILRAKVMKLPVLQDSFLVHFAFDGIMKTIFDWEEFKKFTYETSEMFFELPKKWEEGEKLDWNLRRYIRYIRMHSALAKEDGLLYAHFFQPVRELFKPLTEQEKHYPAYINPENYLKMNEALEGLAAGGFPTFSLIKIFDGDTRELYGDHIHCKRDGKHSLGYEMMSKAIVAHLAKAWHLKPKRKPASPRVAD